MPTNSELAAKIAAGRYTRGMDGDFKILRDEVKRLRAINAELLAACESAAAVCSLQALRDRADIPTHKGWLKLESDIRAVAAKAKG